MAGNRSLGILTLDLVVKTGAFVQGMTAAERQAAKSLSAIEKRAYAFGRTLGAGIKAGAVIATAALTAVAVAVGQAIDRADEMRDLSIRTGIATEKLSEYAYAAKQTGTDIEGLATGLKLFSKNLKEAADPTSGKGKLFAALGVEVTDAVGNIRQLSDILPEVADKFKLLADGPTKTALALELFGKSGANLIEFLNSGSQGLDEFGAKARELGIIISTQTANAADQFNDKVGDLKAQVQGFSNIVAAALLPQLIKTVEELGGLIKQGDLAANTVTLISGALSFGVGILKEYNNAVSRLTIALILASEASAGLQETQKNVMSFGFADGTVAGGVKRTSDAYKDAQRSLDGLIASQEKAENLARVKAETAGQYTDSNQRRRGGGMSVQQLQDAAKNRAAAEATQVRINAMFASGGSSPKAKKSGGGKSEETRELEQMEEAYKRMTAQQRETIALFGQEGEAVKVAYDIKNGELAKWLPARQQEVLENAKAIDQQSLMAELEEAAAKASRAESEAIMDGIKATDQVISDMEFELELLGKTNAERAKAIELRNLDANATDEQRARVAELTDELIRASENQAFLDDFKTGLADAFADFVTGAKSAKEAFGDFADALFKRAVQFVADKAINAMFDAFSGKSSTGSAPSGGGSGAGFWGNLLSGFMSLFGGGKATGGDTMPGKFYRVNENGTEMLSIGNKDYLMMGNSGGRVTAAGRGGGGGGTFNFMLAAPTSQSTQEQIAQRVSFEQQQAQRRNG